MTKSGRCRAVASGAVVLVLSGCTGHSIAGRATRQSPSPVTAAPQFAALPSSSDGEDQVVQRFARLGETLVAVGRDESGGISRPLLLWSDDDGVTWRRGTVAVGSSHASVNDDAFAVAAGHGRVVAIGNGAGESPSAWTSADGRRWGRHDLSERAFGTTSSVTAVRATATGFVAVGYDQTPGAHRRAAAWTSPDGLTWTGRTVPPAGPFERASDVAAFDAAVDDRGGVLAVGAADDGDYEQLATWRSPDSGVTWQRVRWTTRLTPRTARSALSAVEWTGRGFVAAGATQSTDAPVYRGLTARLPGAAFGSGSWQLGVGRKALRTPGQLSLTAVAADPSRTAVFGTTCAATCALYGAASTATGWNAIRFPGGDGTAFDVTTAVRTSRGTVLVGGYASPYGDEDARIWRVADGAGSATTSRIAVPPAPPGVEVEDAAADGATRVVVGSSGPFPVVWRSSGSRPFGTPVALSRDPRTYVTGVEHGPSGWLAYGGETARDRAQSIVWISSDAVHWARTAPRTFGAETQFAYNEIRAAVPFAGWTVVGYSTTNGPPSVSAMSYTLRSGAWRSADTRAYHLHGRDRFYDLAGDVAGTREMSDAAQAANGMIAVGSAERSINAGRTQAAVWSSPDARTWLLSWLPTPSGTGTSGAEAVAVGQTRVAVAGTQRTSAGTRLLAWSSADNGVSFAPSSTPSIAAGPRAEVRFGGLVSVAGGFALLGSVGDSDNAVPFLLVSADGRSWHRRAITDHRLARAGDWTIAGVRADGDVIRALATRRTSVGVTSFAFEQRG